MRPSDRKSPFLLQFWVLDPNSYPKIHHSKYHLRLEQLSEEEMRDAIERDEYYDCMERSSVSEIKQWVKDGAIEVEGVPAFKEDEESDGEDDI